MLVWLLLILLGLVLATWGAVAQFGVWAIVGTDERCPGCGNDLGVTDGLGSTRRTSTVLSAATTR